jgi:hypothetical protein
MFWLFHCLKFSKIHETSFVMVMNCQFEWFRIETIIGSQKTSNFCWVCIILLCVLGFFLVGISIYFGQDLIPLLSSQQIIFVLQGIIMCFYGIANLFLSFYMWCTIMWNIGSGYKQFDKQEEMVHFFCWGFPRGNCYIHIQFFMKDI